MTKPNRQTIAVDRNIGNVTAHWLYGYKIRPPDRESDGGFTTT